MFRVERVTTVRCTSEYTRDEVVTLLACTSPSTAMTAGLRDYYDALDDDALAVEFQDSLYFEPPVLDLAARRFQHTSDVKFAVVAT